MAVKAAVGSYECFHVIKQNAFIVGVYIKFIINFIVSFINGYDELCVNRAGKNEINTFFFLV